MAKNEDDFYITTLKYIRKQTLNQSTVDHPETLRYVLDECPTATEPMITRIYNHSVHDHGHWSTMTPDAYFQLMEYEELHQARESSKTALLFAILALVVSTLVGVGAIING